MNIDRLKDAEVFFMMTHPEGFNDPELQALANKKHKMAKMTEASQLAFKKAAFSNPRQITDDMVRLVSRSSMVSMFEKPKFRDFVAALPEADIEQLSQGLQQFLYGNQKKGFEAMLEVLLKGKLAKWSLMTILPNYVKPDSEVFVKPTTTKNVIKVFEIEDLIYKPRPSWEFYQRYRDVIGQMKELVDSRLSPSNAAFSGFLMMTMEEVGGQR